jgi:hypothetical protein
MLAVAVAALFLVLQAQRLLAVVLVVVLLEQMAQQTLAAAVAVLALVHRALVVQELS